MFYKFLAGFYPCRHWSLLLSLSQMTTVIKKQSKPDTYSSNFIFFFVFVRSKDGTFLVISSTDGYCSFVTFEEGEIGVPLKERPPLILKTPSAAEKKVRKSQGRRVSSPILRAGELTPSTKLFDQSSPSNPIHFRPTAATTSSDLPISPVGITVVPATPTSEDRKSGQNRKAAQPRRITLNTLEAWSKPIKPSTPSTPSPRLVDDGF